MLRRIRQKMRPAPSGNPLKTADSSPSHTATRPPVSLVSPVCPYCGNVQDPPPRRNKECSDCGEMIHIWIDQDAREKHLLTASQHRRRRREKSADRYVNLSLRIIEATRDNNWQELATTYFEKASLLFHRGHDHRESAVLSLDAQLRHYRQEGVSKVKISVVSNPGTLVSCVHCLEMHGRQLGVEEALTSMLIPFESCQTSAHKNRHGGWCRCLYLPVA